VFLCSKLLSSQIGDKSPYFRRLEPPFENNSCLKLLHHCETHIHLYWPEHLLLSKVQLKKLW
jgi:hypothetical protein